MKYNIYKADYDPVLPWVVSRPRLCRRILRFRTWDQAVRHVQQRITLDLQNGSR